MDEREELFAKAQELGLNPDKRWGLERLRNAIAGVAPDPAAEGNQPPAEPAPAAAPVPTLKDYIADVEGKHVSRDVFAVHVTHPAAEDRIYPGRYSGIRVRRGPLSVRYSDGTTE